MEPAIQVGPQVLNTPELIQKIRQYRLLPQLVQELVIDQLIGGITCDQQEAYEHYCTQHNLLSDEQRQAWCQQHQLEPQHLVIEAMRAYRLHRFKEDTWGAQVQSDFMQRKAQYERAIYSMIRTNVREEKLIPAQLDGAMRQRLLNEQFQALLNQKMRASPIKLLPKVEPEIERMEKPPLPVGAENV